MADSVSTKERKERQKDARKTQERRKDTKDVTDLRERKQSCLVNWDECGDEILAVVMAIANLHRILLSMLMMR